jgi:hypothetical protein
VSDQRTTFTAAEARAIGEEIGIDWATSPFDSEQLRIGMNVELEHTDLQAFGASVESLLRDRAAARRLGRNAHRRVTDEFLGDRHLEQYGVLFEQLQRETS